MAAGKRVSSPGLIQYDLGRKGVHCLKGDAKCLHEFHLLAPRMQCLCLYAFVSSMLHGNVASAYECACICVYACVCKCAALMCACFCVCVFVRIAWQFTYVRHCVCVCPRFVFVCDCTNFVRQSGCFFVRVCVPIAFMG